MKYNVLTQFQAKNLPAGKHADGQGLWLVKTDTKRGKWVLRLVSSGKRKEMGLGRWPDVGIGEARDLAGEARKTLRGGNCPVEARRKSRRVIHRYTVKEAVHGCFEARRGTLKGDGEAGRWMSPLKTHVLPKLGAKPIEDVDQHVLIDLFSPIWNEKPIAAAKALRRMGLSIMHAAALGLNVDTQAVVKARAILGKQKHVETHIPSLPYQDAPKFYKWLCTLDTVSSRALRFLMLTCARTTEVRKAKRIEIAGDVWSIPAERTKTDKGQRVPLGKEALEVLALCGNGEYLFPALKGQPISDATMAKLMKDHEYSARPHGFRATFRTWAEEVADADFETKESCLGHAVDKGVIGAYQRSDRLEKRRALLAKWEAYLLG